MRPDDQAGPTRQRRRNLLAALGVLSLLALSVASFGSYRDLRVGRGRELDLRRQITASERRIELLERRVERLRVDPAMVEQLAREELMMARPGEIVIVLPDEIEPEGEAARGGSRSDAGQRERVVGEG